MNAMTTRLATRLAVALSLVVGATPVEAQQAEPVSYDVNGLHVIQAPAYNAQIVSVNLYFLGGTQQLTPSTAGIERLALNAAAGGTRRYPDSASTIAFSRTASRLRVLANLDWTVFGFTGLVDQFDSAWAVFADRVVAPTLDSAAVATAKARLRLDVHRRRVDPAGMMQAIADSVIFAGHPYGIDPNGTDASMDRITTADVRRYVGDQFVTSRMLLVIIGAVPREHVEQVVAATLGTLPRGTYKWTPPPPLPTHDRATLTAVERPLTTDYLFGYFNGPPATHSDYAAFHVATDLLSGRLRSATGRENQRPSPDVSLSYVVFAPFYGAGIARGAVFGMIDSPNRVLPIIHQQIQVEQNTGIPLLAFTEYVKHYTSSYYLSHQTSTAQADQLARAQILFGDYRRRDAELQDLQHVSVGEIQAASRYFMRHLQFVYLGARQDLDASELDAF
jgi:zinc protease